MAQATVRGMTIYEFILPIIISIPKITPAIGALKVAAIAEETPALKYIGRFILSVFMAIKNISDNNPPSLAIGPSLPIGTPKPMLSDVRRRTKKPFINENLPLKRNEIAELIRSGIKEQIDKKQGIPVELATVNLREIVLPPKIVEQIERVQIAKQEGDRVQLEVLRAKQEAEKKQAVAHGTAEARRIQAKGHADAVRIEADADAYANIEISKSLTDDVLRLKQIEVQGQFNQALSVNKNAQIFLTPGGSTPNIWVDSKTSQQKTATQQ